MQRSSRLTARPGVSQFIGWSSGFYLPAILAVPISGSLGVATETFFWAFTVALLVAAFLGPRVGKAIDRLGGRRVLPFGGIAFILGLTLLAASTSIEMLFAAWVLIGIGAAMGNYEAAFATVITFFGEKSTKIIAGITVFVGLSSTISWQLNAWVSENFGWQAAVSMLSHPVGAVLILVFGVDALVPFVILQGIAVGLDPFIRGTLPLLFFGPEQFGQRQGYIMMFSKIVGAFSPLLLTIIVVRNPTAGILTTMGMGIAASVLLLWLAGIRKHRESIKLMAIAN